MSRFVRLIPSLVPEQRRWWLALAWVGLALGFISPVTQVLAPDLDSSIHATYAHFTAHGFQFGDQVNTTAGPYGFVAYGWDYAGELFWPRLALVILCALSTAALTLWSVAAASGRGMRWIWLATLFAGISIGDNLFTLPLFLGGLYLLFNYENRDRRAGSAGVAIFLALLALMKGTQLALALGVLCCVALLALRLRSWRRAGEIIGVFLLALLGWWLGAGQNPAHFPDYVDGIRQIAQGYNEAMAIEESARAFGIGAALLAVVLLSLAWTLWQLRTHPLMPATGALVAGFALVSWKHGYVRADGHVYIFLDLSLVLAASLPWILRVSLPAPLPRTPRLISLGLLGVAAVLHLGGGEALAHGRTAWLATSMPGRWLENAHYVFNAAEVKRERDAELREQRRLYDLPAVRARVQQRSIDFFGHEMGLLLLNGLNYHPAPMACATYHVYNRHFKQLNRRHFADPATRPDFVLLKTQSIDDRLIAQDDSLSLLALLDLYRPILVENETLLLESRGLSAGLQHARPLGSRKIKFNEAIEVPDVGEDDLLLFTVSLPANALGRARSLVYKPPLVFMDLEGDRFIQPVSRRLLAGSLAVPCLLNPVLETTPDFLALFTRAPTKRVERIRLHTTLPACFDEAALEVHFFTVRRPEPVAPAAVGRAFHPEVYHDAPDALEPPDALVHLYQGRRVQYLSAPASFRYDLKGDERLISMVIGMDENTYLQGRTDGVAFYIEFQQPGQPIQLLAQRHLRPASEPADRGFQSLAAVLPPSFAAGSTLTVRTDPGTSRDSGWDWAFATSIDLIRGPLRPEQFPHFNTPPTATEGAINLLSVEGHDVVMMGPPAAVTFSLSGDEQRLTFTAAMVEGSYLSGETDGVGFNVELLLPDGPVQTVFNRVLEPKTVPADRGPQSFTVSLPPFPAGARLRLRTDEGRHGNAAWDWAYVSELSLH